MAIENGIRLSELPEGAVAPARIYGIGDNTSLQFTPKQVADAGHPFATSAEAVAGASLDVVMNPATTRVAIDARVSSEFAPLIEDAQNAADAAAAAAAEATAAAAGVSALYTVPDYATAVLVAGTLPAEVLVISADVDGVETRWIRDPAGTALGGGWTAAERATARNYGEPSGAALAAAVVDNVGGSVIVDYDEQVLPSDYSRVMLEYTAQATARNITQTGYLPDQAMRTLRGQHPAAHPDVKFSTLNVEGLASGSGKNGPFSADYGVSINMAKKGYATGTAVSGEIDGLTIYVRQDGARGLPNGDPGSSDACGILINAQNVEDVGFICPIEVTSSNIQGSSPFAFRYRIQAQMAPITANAAGGPITYGSVVVSKDGANNHAFYAGAEGSATWNNILHSPQRVSVTWDGEYRILTPDWALGALRVFRGRNLNDASQIIHRGTGALQFTTSEAAAIGFATSGTERFRITATGNIVPVSGQNINVGDPGSRMAGVYTGVLSSNGAATMTNLPVYADNAAALAGGLGVGRLYRTATGSVQVVF